jgi:hypothetical protein
MIVLTVVLPEANRTDAVVAPVGKGQEAATGAGIGAVTASDHVLKRHSPKCGVSGSGEPGFQTEALPKGESGLPFDDDVAPVGAS